MKRLWVQQTLAFSVVIIVIMSTVAILVNRSTVQEFREYITLRDMRGGDRQRAGGTGCLLSAARQLGGRGKLAGGRRVLQR